MARRTEWRSGFAQSPSRGYSGTIFTRGLVPGETVLRHIWWYVLWQQGDMMQPSYQTNLGAVAQSYVPVSQYPPPVGPRSAPDAPWSWIEPVAPQISWDLLEWNLIPYPLHGLRRIDDDTNHRNNGTENERCSFSWEASFDWGNTSVGLTVFSRMLVAM